jgi:hypothetical protein
MLQVVEHIANITENSPDDYVLISDWMVPEKPSADPFYEYWEENHIYRLVLKEPGSNTIHLKSDIIRIYPKEEVNMGNRLRFIKPGAEAFSVTPAEVINGTNLYGVRIEWYTSDQLYTGLNIKLVVCRDILGTEITSMILPCEYPGDFTNVDLTGGESWLFYDWHIENAIHAAFASQPSNKLSSYYYKLRIEENQSNPGSCFDCPAAETGVFTISGLQFNW